MKSFDFLVIGGGSAGYNAARVAVSHGLKTAVVDGAKELGGLCILNGCMPSKSLLYMAEVLHLAQKGKKFGLKIPSARADMKAMHARKKKLIAEFAASRLEALHAGKFKLIRSHARFIDANTVELSTGGKCAQNTSSSARVRKSASLPSPGSRPRSSGRATTCSISISSRRACSCSAAASSPANSRSF